MHGSPQFRLWNVRCPVCRLVVPALLECCSSACLEELTDARENVGWTRVRNEDLKAALSDLESHFGLIQMKMERREQQLPRLELSWTQAAGDGEFAKANKLRQKALRMKRQAQRLASIFGPLERRWQVLKKKSLCSERKLARMERILGHSG